MQFFANVGHELRTPLALILGPLRRTLDGAAIDAETRRHLEMAKRNARLLFRHVSDLLDVAKLEAGRMTTYLTEVDRAHLTRATA